MGILTTDMQRLVRAQRLGYVATVCPDGTPNLSPKGTVTVWDDDHLVFADIRSPRTIANLRHNPVLEINVVDPFSRLDYRFKGTATVVESGNLFARIVAFYREQGSESKIRRAVLVEVTRALPLRSPAYDQPVTEAEVRARWERIYLGNASGGNDAPAGGTHPSPGT